MNLKVLETPTEDWIDRLRSGHWIYLVKEREIARVAWPWEPPDDGGTVGQICIHRFCVGQSQVWYVRLDGTGIDGKPLIAPMEGNLPDDPKPLPEPEIRKLQRAMTHFDRRLSRLESAMLCRKIH